MVQAKTLWRGVEAQHLVSTMSLVDRLDEQLVLEQLLEGNKPATPAGRHDTGAVPHPLLFTPFRYRSSSPSRFRRPGDTGIWYGAEEIETACTELANWRHRFLQDNENLAVRSMIVELTFFRARVYGVAIDLSAAPWDAQHDTWTDGESYAACQQFADACRDRGDIAWIRYWSARQHAGHCAAVLDHSALSMVEPFSPQTWVFKVSDEMVLMEHYGDRLSLAFQECRQCAP